jgi:hypothetical protein
MPGSSELRDFPIYIINFIKNSGGRVLTNMLKDCQFLVG